MGKRLVCHWKELSAVNLITTLLLPLHLSLCLSLSLLLSFQLLPSLAEPEQAERESVRGISATHIIINVDCFTGKKYFPSSLCILDLADASPIIVKMFSHRVYVGENPNK